jgi:hypothetical protein
MARETPASSAKLRRRIPLELTVDELNLLEREQPRFGSKRATLVAGLEALTRALGLDQELEQALRERDQACQQAEAEAKRAEKSERAIAKEQDGSRSRQAGPRAGRAQAGEAHE